jgi:hypothetical protein
MADKLLLNPTVDGLLYWAVRGTPHYGRFTAVERAAVHRVKANGNRGSGC